MLGLGKGLSVKGRWHLRLAITGILIAFISSTVLDFLPSRHAVLVTDYRYEALDWLSRAAAVILIIAFLLWLKALWRVPRCGPLYVAFLTAGMFCFLFANFGSIVYAKSPVFGAQWWSALGEALLAAVKSPGATLILAAPFLLLALIAAFVARSGRIAASAAVFGGGIGALSWIYVVGYIDAQVALVERKWTASALALGSMPLKGLLLLAALYALYVILLHLTGAHRRNNL